MTLPPRKATATSRGPVITNEDGKGLSRGDRPYRRVTVPAGKCRRKLGIESSLLAARA